MGIARVTGVGTFLSSLPIVLQKVEPSKLSCRAMDRALALQTAAMTVAMPTLEVSFVPFGLVTST